ncbi:MAG TPA: DUF1800 domain-containing protein [Vicinamibacterales bacterium]|nr:DUF1800 domain-containing protein [Vicinamibacterales bacterium]
MAALVAMQNSALLTAGADVPSDRAAVEHALNRLTFGPRPGQVEEVRRLGLTRWLDQQLNPSAIDDAALATRLRPLPDRPDDIGRVAVRNLSEQERMEAQRRARQFSRQSVQALAAQKLTRAVYSERQLEEVLVDFWFNHFNVFAGKGRTATYIPEYEQEAIRPHIWGSFRDLLGATAKSPAMLFYLDNWLSADPKAAEQMQQQVQRARRRGRLGGPGNDMPPQNQQAPRRNGLNENYARELMELHTLGVDGGYTQQDIVEVARALTGWTLANGIDGGFRFTPALHDRGEKKVLGHTIRGGGGIEDGERVLDIVAAHPSTARHIATKLVRRFVNDEPPAALIDKVAATFTKTKGNLREVVRTLVTAPEFYAAEHRNAKVKTPLAFVVSGVRATGRDVRDPRPMLNALQQLGMAPYMCQPPTGYDDTAETWVSAGALVTRMNIAQQLAPQRAAEIGGPAFQRH